MIAKPKEAKPEVDLEAERLAAENIECDSKGQNEPIASNDTREGRAKNRRASIRIK